MENHILKHQKAIKDNISKSFSGSDELIGEKLLKGVDGDIIVCDEVYSYESVMAFQKDLNKSFGNGYISSDEFEKAKKDLSRLAMRQIFDKNGHKRIVYVKVHEDEHGKTHETDFDKDDSVKFTKDGKEFSGTIKSMKFHDKTDKVGTAMVESDGKVYSVSLSKLSHNSEPEKSTQESDDDNEDKELMSAEMFSEVKKLNPTNDKEIRNAISMVAKKSGETYTITENEQILMAYKDKEATINSSKESDSDEAGGWRSGDSATVDGNKVQVTRIVKDRIYVKGKSGQEYWVKSGDLEPIGDIGKKVKEAVKVSGEYESLDGSSYLENYAKYSDKYKNASDNDLKKYLQKDKKAADKAEHDAIMDIIKNKGLDKETESKKAYSDITSKKFTEMSEDMQSAVYHMSYRTNDKGEFDDQDFEDAFEGEDNYEAKKKATKEYFSKYNIESIASNTVGGAVKWANEMRRKGYHVYEYEEASDNGDAFIAIKGKDSKKEEPKKTEPTNKKGALTSGRTTTQAKAPKVTVDDIKNHLKDAGFRSGDFDIHYGVNEVSNGKYEITTHVNGKRGEPRSAEMKAMNNRPSLPKGFKFETLEPFHSDGKTKMTSESIKKRDSQYSDRGYTDSEFYGSAKWKVVADKVKKSIDTDIEKAFKQLGTF